MLFRSPSAWFTGPPGSRWLETLHTVRDPAPFECLLFSGFAVYGLFLAACAHLPLIPREKRFGTWPIAAAALLTALVWVVLTLATSQTGESMWRAVRHIPGGGAIRVVTRVYITVYLFGTFGAMLWLAAVLERVPRAWGYGILIPVLLFLAWEQTGYEQDNFVRRDFYPHVERHAATLRGAKVGYVVPRFVDETDKVSTGAYGEVFAMWVGMRANVPVVNGYSGRWPHHYPQPPGGALSDDEIREWIAGRYKGHIRWIDSEQPGFSYEIVLE